MRGKLASSGALVGAVSLLSLAATALALAETTQQGSLRVSFAGKIHPRKLPRTKSAPIAISLTGRVSTTDRSEPPQLRRIAIAINRQGKVDTRGIPICRLDSIQPATSDDALRSCGDALVGEGRFLANVALPEQSPFPSNGKVLAFNGVQDGKAVIFAHVYGTEPLPTSYVLPFAVKRRSKGVYGTTLVARLPRIAADWGFISGISLTLGHTLGHGDRRRSYLSAGCPAPAGFFSANFAFARAVFAFEDGRSLRSTLTRRCRVRG